MVTTKKESAKTTAQKAEVTAKVEAKSALQNERDVLSIEQQMGKYQ